MYQLLAQVEVDVTSNPWDGSWWAQFGVLGAIVFFVGVAIYVVWKRFTNPRDGYATLVVNAHSAFLASVKEQTERLTDGVATVKDRTDALADRSDNLHAALDHGLEVAERHARKLHGKDSDVIIDLQNVRRKLRGE